MRTLAPARTLSNVNKDTPLSSWCSRLEEDCGWAEVCERRLWDLAVSSVDLGIPGLGAIHPVFSPL